VKKNFVPSITSEVEIPSVEVAMFAIVLTPVDWTNKPLEMGDEVEIVPDPPPDPQGALAVVRSPPVEAWTQFPEVKEETEKVLFIVEDADTRIPFALPLTRLGKINVSVRFVILQGTDETADADIGIRSNNKSKRIFFMQ
jgi:hypothetical protein